MSEDRFKLWTGNMDAAADNCVQLAEKMLEIKHVLDANKKKLMPQWEGKGANEFEKQYRLLYRQLTDVTSNLEDIADNIIASEESYIKKDLKIASGARHSF